MSRILADLILSHREFKFGRNKCEGTKDIFLQLVVKQLSVMIRKCQMCLQTYTVTIEY